MWYIQNTSIRRFSDFQARMFAHTTANMVSVYRIGMALLIPFFVAREWNTLAITIFVIAVYLDFVDGAIARYQTDTGKYQTDPETEAALSFISRLQLKGCTETGKWLDPFADKFLIQVTFLTLGWSLLPHFLLFTSLGLAITLTFVRPFKQWMFKKGWRKSADGRANIFGKVKMWVEVAVVAELFFLPEGFVLDIFHTIIRDLLMGVAVTTALLSLIFHLMPARRKK